MLTEQHEEVAVARLVGDSRSQKGCEAKRQKNEAVYLHKKELPLASEPVEHEENRVEPNSYVAKGTDFIMQEEEDLVVLSNVNDVQKDFI